MLVGQQQREFRLIPIGKSRQPEPDTKSPMYRSIRGVAMQLHRGSTLRLPLRMPGLRMWPLNRPSSVGLDSAPQPSIMS